MKIDIEKAKQAFKEYVKNYDPEDKKVKLKIEHIERVSQLAKQMAEKLKLDEEDIKLAELIGLLHDIGRFEQIRIYHTFTDKKSINHGEYGAKVLFEDGLIRKFIETDEFDEIIKLAIINHNRDNIEDGLTERQLLHAKLIRDADKIDILYESIDIYYKNNEEEVNKSVLSEKIYNEFTKKATIKKEKNVRLKFIDDITCVIAFIYDINYKTSFEIIKEKDYINKILDRYKFQDQSTKTKVDEIKKIANEYIKEKIMEEK